MFRQKAAGSSTAGRARSLRGGTTGRVLERREGERRRGEEKKITLAEFLYQRFNNPGQKNYQDKQVLSIYLSFIQIYLSVYISLPIYICIHICQRCKYIDIYKCFSLNLSGGCYKLCAF